MLPDRDGEKQTMKNCIIETRDGRHTVKSVNSIRELLKIFGERLARVIWWENIYDRREWRPT